MSDVEVVEKAFPFKFTYEHNFFYIDLEENKDIWQWMLTTFTGEWEYYHIEGGGSVGARKPGVFDAVMEPVVIISIEKEEDAAHFKLRWV